MTKMQSYKQSKTLNMAPTIQELSLNSKTMIKQKGLIIEVWRFHQRKKKDSSSFS